MKRLRLFSTVSGIGTRIHGWLSFLTYKIRQRRHLRKQKAEDPNIYPLW